MKNVLAYGKGIAAAVVSAVLALQTYYGSQHWFVAVLAAAGALGVIGVPNTPKPPTSGGSMQAGGSL